MKFATMGEIMDCHAQFGRLNYHMVKKGMGPNWPKHWDDLGPGDGIFSPDEHPQS